MAFRSHRLRVSPEFVQRGKINTFVVGKVRCAQEEVMFASIQEFRRWPMARCTWGVEVKFTYRDRVRVNEQLVGAICFELSAPSVVILALFWRFFGAFWRFFGAFLARWQAHWSEGGGRRKRGGVHNEQRHVSLPRLVGAKPGTFPEWNVPPVS
ncbi:hypothetical protein B0H13DRAFT_1890116 [Mycena leptocephala]|nr:hypothetical protein B0H13DRAFT_1890116 [Mycena leptocephala]